MNIAKQRTILKIAMFIAALCSVVGILVIIGWVEGISVLKGISPHWATMKISAALCFVLTGIMLGCIIELLKGKEGLIEFFIPTIALLLFAIMGMNMALWALSIDSGFGAIFTIDDLQAIYTSSPGRPSIPTMISFLLIGTVGMIIQFTITALFRNAIQLIGVSIAIIGMVAIMGYILGNPLLYYAKLSIGSAMALHTAVLFVLIGIAMLLLSKVKPQNRDPDSA